MFRHAGDRDAGIAAPAGRLIAQTCQKQEIVTGTRTVHADHGSWMTSTTVAPLLAGLGVTKPNPRSYVPATTRFRSRTPGP